MWRACYRPVHPALSFVANFPPCLQSADLPERTAEMGPSQLLPLLPHTGTLGGMTTFYYTFAYTPPNVPLIPSGGIYEDLYFPASQQSCNEALLWYRDGVRAVIDSYAASTDKELTRLRGHKPLMPTDVVSLYHQWARSIEI